MFETEKLIGKVVLINLPNTGVEIMATPTSITKNQNSSTNNLNTVVIMEDTIAVIIFTLDIQMKLLFFRSSYWLLWKALKTFPRTTLDSRRRIVFFKR